MTIIGLLTSIGYIFDRLAFSEEQLMCHKAYSTLQIDEPVGTCDNANWRGTLSNQL